MCWFLALTAAECTPLASMGMSTTNSSVAALTIPIAPTRAVAASAAPFTLCAK
jgi:hypothetical protein